MQHVYLDYRATTPIDPEVIRVMQVTLQEIYGNPSSAHRDGMKAKQCVEESAHSIASACHASPQGVVWTSGATEAINLALKGVAGQYQRQGRHLITSQIEHAAVLETMQFLERNGFDVTYLPVDDHGVISTQDLKASLREDTILVSLMHANNETGVIQPIAEFGSILQHHQAIFHVDAAQTLGKLPIAMDEMGIDLLSASAHKLYGPKGVGCLIMRQTPRIRLAPFLHGGSQQNRIRPGTLPTHQIAGFAKACEIAMSVMEKETIKLQQAGDSLWEVLAAFPQVNRIGHPDLILPGHLSFWVEGMSSELMMNAMPHLSLSQHSACRQSQAVASHVHAAMGLKPSESLSSLRLSMGRMTTEADLVVVKESFQALLGAVPS